MYTTVKLAKFLYVVLIGGIRKYLLAFSVHANGSRILSVDSAPADGSTLPALHGIRFLSMSWVILGHTWVVGIGVIGIGVASKLMVFSRPLSFAVQCLDWHLGRLYFYFKYSISAWYFGFIVARWLSGRASDLRSKVRGFEPRPRRCCATTLGMLFTPHCLCHQAV